MKKIVDFFSKEFQNELKVKYEEACKDVWGKDTKMVDYEMKNIVCLIPICDGKSVICLNKPTIEKEFWFGESDMGQGPSHEDNCKRMNYVHLTLKDYFMNENLSKVDDMINKIKDAINDKSCYVPKRFAYYYKCPDDHFIQSFGFENPYNGYRICTGNSYELSKNDLKIILEGYKFYREKFVKRLESYLKKYGTSKMSVRSYWIDR